MSDDTPGDPGALTVAPSAPPPLDAAERRDRLKQVFLDARGCTRCAQLAATRSHVVFGSGHADASLMLVGEVPSAREDEEGVPFTGATGKLLEDLLASIGVPRADVFITHVLKCRPPGNRDADPAELARCRPWLEEQVRLVQPRVICTLGNFATRALTGDATSVTERHGQVELVDIGGTVVHLVPLFHPSAALYTRALLDTLREDFAQLPELLARPAPAQPVVVEEEVAPPEPEVIEPPEPSVDVTVTSEGPTEDDEPSEPDEPGPPDSQLGLF